MIKLALYISKTFILSWIMVTFGFLILIALLDSMANGAEILSDGRGFMATFQYMAYRAPVIFDRVLLFTIMVAMLAYLCEAHSPTRTRCIFRVWTIGSNTNRYVNARRCRRNRFVSIIYKYFHAAVRSGVTSVGHRRV